MTTQEKVLIGAAVLAVGTGAYLVVRNKGRRDENQYWKQSRNVPANQQGAPVVNLDEIAMAIAKALGTDPSSSWWNGGSWSEDETQAMLQVQKVPRSLIPELGIRYANLTKRSLRADLQKYLSDSQWNQISYLFQ